MEENKRQEFIKSLCLELSDKELTKAQLEDFRKRSRTKIGGSPAMESVRIDINAMNELQLLQVIEGNGIFGLFTKQFAKLRLKSIKEGKHES